MNVIPEPPVPNIDDCNTYVDGVTITYGSNPRKHIWTFACGQAEDGVLMPYRSVYCPCNNESIGTSVPSFLLKVVSVDQLHCKIN